MDIEKNLEIKFDLIWKEMMKFEELQTLRLEESVNRLKRERKENHSRNSSQELNDIKLQILQMEERLQKRILDLTTEIGRLNAVDINERKCCVII